MYSRSSVLFNFKHPTVANFTVSFKCLQSYVGVASVVVAVKEVVFANFAVIYLVHPIGLTQIKI